MIEHGRWAVGRALLGLALAASAVCTPVRSLAVEDPCIGPGADTAGWTVVDAGPFQFSVPPGYRHQPGQGIDSYVGRWEGPEGRFVEFDWGMYSGSLGNYPSHLRDAVECEVEIGGHPAHVVRGFDPAEWRGARRGYVAAAAWPYVRTDTHLSLTAASPAASDVPVLVSIVRSVRFKPGEPVR